MTRIEGIKQYNSINFSSNKNCASSPQKTDNTKQEEGLSSTSKALIAIGILGAAGIGLYILTKGKKGGEQLSEAGQDARRAISSGKDDIILETPRIVNNAEPYANTEVVAKLKALTGSKEEKLVAAKKIFMEELGYNPDLIKIEFSDKMKSADLFNPTSVMGGFNYYTGSLIINKKLFEQMPDNIAISLLRHELDHFDKAAKICKSIGIEEYQNLFKSIPESQFVDIDGSKLSFNQTFWKSAVQEAKTDGFDSEKYTQALRNYFKITQPDCSLYSKYMGDYEYITNPMETSAYSIEHSLEKSLNTEQMQTLEYLTKDFKQANDVLNKLIKQQPELEKYKSCIFDYLFSKAVVQSNTELNTMHTRLLKEPHNAELGTEFHKKLQQKFSAIRGSFLGKDEESEIKAFQKLSEIAQKPLSPSELVDAINARERQLYDALNNFMIPQEDKELIKPMFLEVNKQLLEYMGKNGIDNPKLELQLLLKQLIIEKDIKGLQFMFGLNLEELHISKEILSKIYSNKVFQNTMNENTQYTQEQILCGLLKSYAGSRM